MTLGCEHSQWVFPAEIYDANILMQVSFSAGLGLAALEIRTSRNPLALARNVVCGSGNGPGVGTSGLQHVGEGMMGLSVVTAHAPDLTLEMSQGEDS